MTDADKERKLVVATALAEIAKAMLEVQAAGPCGYWNREVATKLNTRALEMIGEANGQH